MTQDRGLGIGLRTLALAAVLVAPSLPAAAPPAALEPAPTVGCATLGSVRACFAPGTRQAYVDAMLERARDAVAGDGAKAFQTSDFLRWSFTATNPLALGQGDPITLTWTVVPDGTFVPSGFGESASGSDLRAYLTGIYGSEANWMPLLQRVFDRWGELTGVTYVHVAYDDGRSVGTAAGQLGVRADVRIAGHPIDGPFGVLAYNAFPNDGDMVIDTGDTFFRSRGGNSRALRNVLAHEHGHGIGLDHVCPRNGTKLMEPNVSTGFDGPQHDDVLGAQRLYGDTNEPNDAPGGATDLGTPGPAKFTVTNVSIDDDRDTDMYRVTVPAGTSADVTLRPVGRSYDSGPQSGSGCGVTERLDTDAFGDLRLALLTPAGTVIASADATGAGESEQILDVARPANASGFVIRVRNSGENAVQLYELEMKFVDRGAKPVAHDDADATWQVLPTVTDVLANDEGLDDVPITVRVVDKPAGGKAKVAGTSVAYVPDAGFVGSDAYTYEVRDVHGQTSLAAVFVHVAQSDRAGEARTDTDADGYPDELETALGASATDAASRPGEDIETSGAAELPVSKLSLRIDSRKPDRDALRLTGALPLAEGFEPEGARVVVYVAGIVREFTLDSRGRAETGDGFLRLRVRRSRGVARTGPARFDMLLGGSDFAAVVADEGLDTSRRQRREPRAATVFVLFDGRTYALNAPLLYSARKDRRGKARLVR